MPSDLQDAANIHWNMLNGVAVSRAELSLCIRIMMGDHSGSLFHYLIRNLPAEISESIFHKQPNIPYLLKEWRKNFNSAGGISEHDASRFLLTIYNSLEEVDDIFTNHITPGITRHKRYDFGDFITKRPHGKLGWSLQLTTQGSGLYNCIREQFVTQPGDLILLSPDALYDYRRNPSCDLWQHQWVYFPQEERWQELLKWPEIGPGIHHIRANNSYRQTLKALFDQVIKIHLDAAEFSQALEKNILEQILIRCRQIAPKENCSPVDKRISDITDYISRNFNQPFTTGILATEIGLSPARLSALFKQQTGSTIMHFRDERRMARAAQLLAQTNQAINKVSEAVGYNDPLYFSRCFSQHLSCSPRQYRNRHQNIEYRED